MRECRSVVCKSWKRFSPKILCACAVLLATSYLLAIALAENFDDGKLFLSRITSIFFHSPSTVNIESPAKVWAWGFPSAYFNNELYVALKHGFISMVVKEKR